MKFKVTRDRAYWVKETMLIEADDAETAEDIFYDNFDPTIEIGEPILWVEEQSVQIEEIHD